MRVGRLLATAIVSGVASVAWASPAAASVTPPCDGTVTIPGQDEAWRASSGDPLVLPEGTASVSWTGTTGDTVITDHEGELRLDLGPGSVLLGEWAGENADGETDAAGEYELSDARDDLPFDVVGVYEISGSHAGEGGSCSGTVTLVVEGSPLSTPLGVGGIAAMVLGAAGLAAAGAGGAAAAAGGAATTGGASAGGASAGGEAAGGDPGGGPPSGDGAGGA